METHFSCGNRIRQLRLERGLSQERLALNAEITPAYLGQLERGRKNATVMTIERICRAMNVSLADFFATADHPSELDDEIGKQILYNLNGLSAAERSVFLRLIKDVLQIRQMGVEEARREG